MGFFSKTSEKNTDDEKWKHKYLDLLDTQEHTEKTQKQNQELLYKTIVRLSILASGIDSSLEPFLQNIRDNVKKGVNYPQLNKELENLTSAITRLDENKPEKEGADNNNNTIFFEFLRQRFSSEPHQQAFTSLEKEFQLNGDKEQLFAALNRIIDDEKKHVTVIQADTLSKDADQEFASSPAPSITNNPVLITTPLIKLLDRIDIPEGFTQKADALKQQLENQEQSGSFEPLWENLTRLLVDINAKNQTKEQEIDNFLTHINEQLTELGLAITDSGIALMDATLSRNKLDESVYEQMDDLQHRSSNATQLEPLKQVISSHIAIISKEIHEHKQKEIVQREKYQRQLDELSQKIKVMEQETGELQSKLVTANTNAQRDVLTELPNRLAYDERLKMEMARWQRYHTPLCLVVIDIDYFKRINDQYGHQAGDKVLEKIAHLFTNNIRRADFIARFGGEEFVMLLPHTNKHSALKMTDKLRTLIENSCFNVDGATISISISCGITQFFKGDTHESAFKRADEALYRAKDQGRNQCCSG